MRGGRLAAAALWATLVVGLAGCAGAVATPAPVGPSPTAAAPSVGTASTSAPSASPPRFFLSKSFKSPLMGYSIKVAEDWTVTPATGAWVGTTNNEGAVVDAIVATGTERP